MVKTTTAQRPVVDEAELLVPVEAAAPDLPILGTEPYAYVFRSAPGKYLGDVDHYMDCPDPKWEEPDDDPASRRWARLAKANWLERNKGPELREALDQAFFDTHGTGKVTFRYQRGANGLPGMVSFGTDSEAIATVLRADIRRGKVPFVTEIDQSRYLKVGAARFANTEFGRAAAHDYLAKHGGALELVEKG